MSSYPDPPAGEAFYGLAGEIVRMIEPHSEADPMALLVQLLVAFGNVLGRTAHFLAEKDQHFTNLFGCLVGETSKGRKGTALGQIKSLFADIDKDWMQTRIQSGLSSGEGLIWHVRDPIMKMVQNVSSQTDAGIADKRVLLIESELASTIRVIEREGNTLSPVIRLAWDTGSLQSLVKQSPARATGAHVSIIGHITQDELRRYLGRTEVANGFANRFLFICVRRSKLLPHGGSLNADALLLLQGRLAQAVEHARTPTIMNRDLAAAAVWEAVYGPLSEGKPGLLGAVIGRAEAQVMRLALIYSVLDCAKVIGREHLLAALAVWDYAEASARHIFGDASGDPVTDQLLRAIREAGSNGMNRTQIRDFFGRNRKAEEIDQALEMLMKQRHVRGEMHTNTGGRPAETWIATTTLTTETTKGCRAGGVRAFKSYLELAKSVASSRNKPRPAYDSSVVPIFTHIGAIRASGSTIAAGSENWLL